MPWGVSAPHLSALVVNCQASPMFHWVSGLLGAELLHGCGLYWFW